MRRLMFRNHRYCWVAALVGWSTWAIAGAAAFAAEPSGATSAEGQPLDFSGGSRSEWLLPDAGSDAANRARLEFLNQRSSVGGVLQGSGGFAAPVARPSNRNPRNTGSGTSRVDFEEIWFQDGQRGGGGPSAADFERAAGLRTYGSASWGGGAVDSMAPSERAASAPSARPIDSSSVDMSSGRLNFSPDYTIRRSLDPVLDFGVPGRNLNTSGIDRAPGFDFRSGPTEPEQRGGLRPDLLNPLGPNQFGDLTSTPRTVRELIDNPRPVRTRESADMVLDRDSTRDELNPYTPRWREDFQFSLGDSRLGINPQTSGTANRGLSPLRGQDPRTGPSSLAPALVMPVPESVAVPTRRQSEAQFPGRRF
jgi:hypothetical protein